MSELTVEVLKDLAKQGKTFNIITEECVRLNEFYINYNENNTVRFHINSKIIMYCHSGIHFELMAKLQNMFEEAYQGFYLEIEELIQGQCTFIIKKNDIESLKISDDYKLATEKMSEVKELRKLTEEALDIQKESAVRINDLFKKLEDVREYAKNLQLKEENEKKVSEQLDNINSDIKELEIRLKKDIPELDKSLDINNFR
jgi:hypothetical protein